MFPAVGSDEIHPDLIDPWFRSLLNQPQKPASEPEPDSPDKFTK